MSELKIEVLQNEINQFDLAFKLIVIGDSGVGKSCLSIKATKDYFDYLYSPTVGFEFLSFHMKINEQVIKLQIWDTCGQENYRALINSFYRNSSLAILVYSIDNRHSFENLETWLNDIKIQSNPDIKIILIGNKADLEDNREITKEEGEMFATEHKLGCFMETSAKTGLNAKELFIKAGKILYEEHLKKKDNKVSPALSLPYIPDAADQTTEYSERSRPKGCAC